MSYDQCAVYLAKHKNLKGEIFFNSSLNNVCNFFVCNNSTSKCIYTKIIIKRKVCIKKGLKLVLSLSIAHIYRILLLHFGFGLVVKIKENMQLLYITYEFVLVKLVHRRFLQFRKAQLRHRAQKFHQEFFVRIS